MKTYYVSIAISLLPSVNLFSQAGSLDVGFGNNGILIESIGPKDEVAYDIAQQPDGKLVVAATLTTTGISGPFFTCFRYLPDGTRDSTFSNDGLAATLISPDGGDEPHAISIQADGKIILAGSVLKTGSPGIAQFGLLRYTKNGSKDNSFGTAGIVQTQIGGSNNYSGINDMVVQPDGKIVTGGWAQAVVMFSSDKHFALARYNQDGSLDNTFGNLGLLHLINNFKSEEINGIALQPDGKILAVGYQEDFNENQNLAVLRFNPDGSSDNTFGINGIAGIDLGGNLFEEGRGVLVLPDGKILVGGRNANNTTFVDAVAIRLLSDGSLDAGFGNGGLASVPFSYGSAIARQADAKIVLAGFTINMTSGNFEFNAARFLENGTLDSSFGNAGTVSYPISDHDSGVISALIQSDNKIVLAGAATFVDPITFIGKDKISIVRLLPGAVVETSDLTFGQKSLRVFPNPATRQFSLAFSGMEKPYEMTVQLFDVNGGLVKTFIENAPHSADPQIAVFEIPSTIANGLYFVKISTSEGILTQKLFIQNIE